MAIQRNYLQAYEDFGDMGGDEFTPEVMGALPAVASQPAYEPSPEPAPVAQPVYELSPEPVPVAQPVYAPPPVAQQPTYVGNDTAAVGGLPVVENVSPVTQDADASTGALPVAQPPAAQQSTASTPVAKKPAAPSQETIDALTKQILGQGTSSKWTGEGYGSAEKNAADMAKILAGIGITDIHQFGKIPQYETQSQYQGQQVNVDEDGNTYIMAPGGGGVDDYGNPMPSKQIIDPRQVEQVQVKTGDVFGNKETGQVVPNTYSERQTGNFFGGTFAGKGNTGYGVQFDAQGNPIFYTQGASSNDLANIMKDLGPIGQIGLAVATGGLSIPEQIAANMAVQVLSGKDIGDAIKGAAVSWAGAQIPGLDAIKEGTSFLNGIDSTGALSNAFQNAAVSGAKAALTGQDIGNAISTGALTGGANGVVNAVLGSDDFKDLSAPQKAIAANVITGAISGKPIDQVLINSAIAAANSAIAEEKKSNAQQVLSPYFTPTTTTVAGGEEPPTGALQVATATPTIVEPTTPTPVEPTPTGGLPTTTTPIAPTPVEPTPTGALQLAAATPITTTDAGNGYTMPGVDAKTAAMLAGFNDVNKIATGATTLPDWVKLADGEEVTGTRFDLQGQQRYEITRANPNDPDKPVIYDVIRDPTTGQVTYEWGGVAFDEDGNVLSSGTTVSSSSKPSWTWPTETTAPTNGPTEPTEPTEPSPTPIEFTSTTPSAPANVTLGALGNAAPAGTSGALPVTPPVPTVTPPATVTSPPVDATTASTTGPVIVNPLSSVTTQQPPAPVNANTTNTTATTPTSPATGALSSATTAAAASTVNPAATTTSSTVNPAATTSSAVNLSSTGNPTSTATSNTAGTPGGNIAGTPGGVPNGSINGVPNGSLTGVVGGTSDGVVDGTGVGPGDGAGGTGPATTNPPSGALPTTPPPVETPPEETPKTPPEETPTTTSSGSSSGTSSGSKSTKTTTTQYGALGATATPTSTGALPGTLTATMLAAAPVKDLSGTMTQLTQLYPQLANIDPRLLQILTSRSGASLPTQQESSTNEGTGLIGAKLAGAPSPGNPTKGEDNSTVIPGVSTGNLTGAGLKYLNGAPLTPFAKGGQVKHIPEFITGKTGNYVQGAGDGQSDSIPAMLADGEYVFDADTVAALGNGSNKAGALVLDKMRENIRKHKRSASVDKIPPKAMSPLSYLKGTK